MSEEELSHPYLLEHYLTDSTMRYQAMKRGTVIDPTNREATAKELEDLLEAMRNYGIRIGKASRGNEGGE